MARKSKTVEELQAGLVAMPQDGYEPQVREGRMNKRTDKEGTTTYWYPSEHEAEDSGSSEPKPNRPKLSKEIWEALPSTTLTLTVRQIIHKKILALIPDIEEAKREERRNLANKIEDDMPTITRFGALQYIRDLGQALKEKGLHQ